MAQALQTAKLSRKGARKQPAIAALSALGVVYGDIGTSALYGLKQAVHVAGTPTPDAVLGIVSLILWSLLLVVTIKYAILVLRADNRGEGGIVALLELLDVRRAPRGSWRASLLIVGLIGAALLYGDGAITPAISVLSAVEGLKVSAPGLAPVVVPLTIAILIGLFLVQRKGTEFVGRIFGPAMLVWFVAIGLFGLLGIIRSPGILAAVSPHYAIAYLVHAGPGVAFAVLGASFLALTGAEAMYADLGHFGRRTIRLGWFMVVWPALMLNYLGQGGLLLADPLAAEHPFFLLAPTWAYYPMVALATVATIIASQSIISGAYSLTQQAIQLGFLPRMRVTHTTSHAKGQIYIPMVNWLLAAGTLAAVLAFGSSDALGGAYGIAVSLLMAFTTVLAALVALRWGYNPLLVAAVNGFFLAIELVFIAANMTKLAAGGWFPLLMAGVVVFLMLTWRTGWQLLERESAKLRQCQDEFMAWIIDSPPIRSQGASAIFTAATAGIPPALKYQLWDKRARRERVLLLAAVDADVPRVAPEQRIKLEPVGAGVTRVLCHFGFMETPNMMEAMNLACREPELRDLDPRDVTFYFRRMLVIPTDKPSEMAVWRKPVFAAMHLNANLPAAYFGIPMAQVVELGFELEI